MDATLLFENYLRKIVMSDFTKINVVLLEYFRVQKEVTDFLETFQFFPKLLCDNNEKLCNIIVFKIFLENQTGGEC